MHVELEDRMPLSCPHSGRQVRGNGKRQKRWHYLDTCQYQTILSAQIPRVEYPEHKVAQLSVPWTESVSRFTATFESLVIDWLKATTTSAVAQQFNLSWSAIDGIMQRAIDCRLTSALLKEGNKTLKGSKYFWQMNPGNMSKKQWRAFKELRES